MIAPNVPFKHMRAFLDEAFHYIPPTEVLDALMVDRNREAQCEGETITCTVCGFTLPASVVLQCGSCAN